MANSGSSHLHRPSPGEKYDFEAHNSFLTELFSDSPSTGEMLINRNEMQNPSFNYGPGLASTEEAGTSSSGRRGRNNGIHHRNTGKTPASSERKREIDKRYRDKCREDKKKMECELNVLGLENTYLHDENKNLAKEKASINKGLQSAETETKQLNIELQSLKSNMANQRILVDSFLKEIDVSSNNDDINHQLKIRKLQNEIIVLRQNNWDDWMMNKVQIVQEIENLEHENKLLTVQVDALCDKVNNNNDQGDTKALEW